MKTPQERFEENYMPVPEPKNNRKGFKIRYVYYGAWYSWDADRLKRNKILIAAACVLGLVFFLLGNCTGANANRSAFVGIPANLSIAVFVFEVLGVIQFCAAKEKVTKPDYQDINMKLRAATLIRAFMLLVAGIGCIITTIVNRLAWNELLSALGYLLSALCSVFIYVHYKRIPFHTEKNQQTLG